MAPWLRYLIAFVVFAHGFVYVRIGSVLPGPIKAWRGRSWLLSDTVTGDQLRRVVVSLHVAAGIALLACAASSQPSYFNTPANKFPTFAPPDFVTNDVSTGIALLTISGLSPSLVNA